ncbi:cytochrome P450 [Streptomyces sp. TX20-6-3]|uniref:cytochrome P450 n=1 Tax=Streptomyces sp. TX20-6-3 TaxID=3028705 RepID=UPI0029B84458|nr:cytochrome P450 [Streptomyces sp. TX20-6-3]MDX2565427.1 cytochrome P450 [Streptomyces sp. TX20-6-3]
MPLQTIPQASGAMPLIGHSIQLLRNPIAFLESLPKKPLVQIRIGAMKAVVLVDRDITKRVLQNDEVFDKGGPFFHRLREVMGNGLGTCPRDEHRQQRRIVQPAFHGSRMGGYAETMSRHISAVTSSWIDGGEIDGRAEMMDLTTRVAVGTMFSDSLSQEDVSEINEDFTTIVRTMYRRMITPSPLDRIETAEKRRYDQARARVKRRTEEVIAERRRAGCPDRGDLLSILLDARDNDGLQLSTAEIHDHLSTFFMAGVMTTASSLSWTLHLLTQETAVQKALQEEVDSVLTGDHAVYADLARLDLAKRVVAESLRLWAPGWFVTRVATRDTELSGYHIPAGTTIVFSPFLIHRQAEVYEEPERFIPDRWLPERGPVPRDAHIPFGGGARKCIADEFSLTQSTLVVATVAARWTLVAAPGSQVKPSYGAVLSPKGLRVITHRRGGGQS